MTKASLLARSSDQECRQILESLLGAYLTPAFGVLPKREVELLMLEALVAVQALPAEPSLHDLISTLRVTRSRARSLLYDRELRRLAGRDLDAMLKEALRRPLLQKQGELFALELENPVLVDHLRKKLSDLGHSSDGSFSSSIVRLSLDAAVALLESYLAPKQQREMKAALVKAGAPDKSLGGAIRAVLKKLAGKVADDTGAALVDEVEGFLKPLLECAKDAVADRAKAILGS
jgi:hypothetical protein